MNNENNNNKLSNNDVQNKGKVELSSTGTSSNSETQSNAQHHEKSSLRSEGHQYDNSEIAEQEISGMNTGCILGCGKELALSGMKDHLLQECPNVEINCLQLCGQRITRKSMEHHMEHECSNTRRCTLLEHGCNFVARGVDSEQIMKQHMVDKSVHHIELLSSRLKEQQSTITELKSSQTSSCFLTKCSKKWDFSSMKSFCKNWKLNCSSNNNGKQQCFQRKRCIFKLLKIIFGSFLIFTLARCCSIIFWGLILFLLGGFIRRFAKRTINLRYLFCVTGIFLLLLLAAVPCKYNQHRPHGQHHHQSSQTQMNYQSQQVDPYRSYRPSQEVNSVHHQAHNHYTIYSNIVSNSLPSSNQQQQQQNTPSPSHHHHHHKKCHKSSSKSSNMAYDTPKYTDSIDEEWTRQFLNGLKQSPRQFQPCMLDKSHGIPFYSTVNPKTGKFEYDVVSPRGYATPIGFISQKYFHGSSPLYVYQDKTNKHAPLQYLIDVQENPNFNLIKKLGYVDSDNCKAY